MKVSFGPIAMIITTVICKLCESLLTLRSCFHSYNYSKISQFTLQNTEK